MKKSVFQPSWVKSTKSTRFHQLRKYFENRDVLDIGCAVGYKKDDWMHKNIKVVSKSICGVDLDKNAVQEISDMGYDVSYADAQSFNLNKQFELVHAGELIEHLENPGGFLSSAKNHLSENGRLLITTPNGLRVSNFLYASTGGLQVNFQHTCWFCEYTISTLMQRVGLEVEEVGYLKHETFNSFRKLALMVRSWILPSRVAWNTLYVVAKKAS